MLLKMVKVMSRLRFNNINWGIFEIGKIFNIENCKCSKVSSLKDGSIPYVGATNKNNGVVRFVEYDPDLITEGNCIAFICDGEGSLGFSVYKSEKFIGSTTVKVGRNKFLNKYNGLFISNISDRAREYYNYGYKRNTKNLKKEKIVLPVTRSNEPDWRFMEDFIKEEMKIQTKKIVEHYEKKLIDEANILLDLEEIKWKLFQIDEIFDVKRVEGKPINNYEGGNIPYVTTSSENNGITNFVNHIESDISKRNAISVDPVGGTTFHHDYDFVGRGFSGSSINLLYNDNLNNFNSKFVCSAIEKISKVKASYGIHFNGNRLKSTKILLPSDKNGKPNWQYMTDFIKKLEYETASKVLDYIYTYYRLAICKGLEFNLESIEWKEFYLDNIFNLIQRGRRLTKRDQFEGDIPYISSTGLNNGLDNFIGNTDKVRVFNDCLTIANSGSVGSTFYHKYEFIGSDHINALKIDKATENIYLFLATKLRSLETKYSFNREINDRRMRREKIMLPVKEGEPDYDFMNKYIAIEKIKSIYKILDYYKGLIKS